jgi:hypothetical protein
MLKERSLLNAIFVTLLWAGTSSCTDVNSLSSNVIFQVPKNPIVVNSPRFITDQLTGQPKVIPAPNFDFSYGIQNNSAKTLIVAGINMVITNTKNGQKVRATVSVNAGTFCPPPPQGQRRYLAIVPPGQIWRGDFDCDEFYVAGDEDRTIIGLPQADSTFYSIELTPDGFFIEPNDPLENPLQRYIGFNFLLTQ